MAWQDEFTDKLKKMPKCKNCKYYDTSNFPEYNGAIAICVGKSERYKVGHHSVCCEFYETSEVVNDSKCDGRTKESH